MKNIYSFDEIVKNIIALVFTKVFFPSARLIRRPIYIRGKSYLQYGEGFTTGYSCRLEMFDIVKNKSKKIVIGKNCKIGDFVHIAAGESVVIGDNCLMASKIFISDINHGDYSEQSVDSFPDVFPDNRPLHFKPVSIGNNVWIGENACILPGVNIGNGCIVGANSVVNKNIPSNSIVAGVPAKVIKKFDEKICKWVLV